MKKHLLLLLLVLLSHHRSSAQEWPWEIDWDAVDEGVQQVQQGVNQLVASETVQAWAVQTMGRIQRALYQADWDQLQEWLPYIDEVETRLAAYPEAQPYIDWLTQRKDYFVFAKTHKPDLTRRPNVAVPPPVITSPRPAVASSYVPPVSYDDWLSKMSQQPTPKASVALVPQLKPIFRKHGVPEELIWLAEVESSFNPSAQSPVGAKGLFQFMPKTARYMGLSTSPRDERVDPEKSADAAARYLAKLYKRFDDWSLTLAAYNAGEGRVSKLLKGSAHKNYNSIQPRLPSETRMYVPKVLATIQVREGVSPGNLPALIK